MPDPRDARRRLLLGGRGAVRFAVSLEAIAGIREHGDLPPSRREVNLPLLFDLASQAAIADRYAEVRGVGEPAFLRLGADVRAEEVAASDLLPLPSALATTGARWGWAGLVRSEEGVIVLIDAAALARMGARRTASEAGS